LFCASIVFDVVYSYRCILVSRQMRKRSTHLLGRAKAEHTAALSPAPGHSAIIFTGPLAKAHAARDERAPAACEDARFVRLGRRRRRCSCGLAPVIATRLVYEPRCRQRRHGRDSLRRRIPHSSASDRERADGRGPRREYLHVAGRPATAFVQSGPGALQQVRRAIRTSTSRPSLLLLCYLR